MLHAICYMKIPAKKSLGQNFLINTGVIARIIETAELNSNDTVIEVGPGTGNLTRALAERAGKVIAIEKDHRLISSLVSLEKQYSNLETLEADCLEMSKDFLSSLPSKYKVVANLPYYITSHFIRNIFEEWPQPELIVLMVQKEVAQRIMSRPPDMNLLALSVQYFSEPSIVMRVSKGSFRPIPSVDSAIIKLRPKGAAEPQEKDALFRLLKAGFAEKRKMLINNLTAHLKIDKKRALEIFELCNISAKVRAEELSLDTWLNLSRLL